MKSHGWENTGKYQLPKGVVADTFVKGECRVILAREPHGKGGKLLYHLSISCADRYPTWEEIKDARYSLMPLGSTVAQILPPMSEYINIHNNTFHLWELD